MLLPLLVLIWCLCCVIWYQPMLHIYLVKPQPIQQTPRVLAQICQGGGLTSSRCSRIAPSIDRRWRMDDTPIKKCMIWCAYLWTPGEGSTRSTASGALIAMLWRCDVGPTAAAIEMADDGAPYYQQVHRSTLGRTNGGVNFLAGTEIRP